MPRISYVDPATVTDPGLRAHLERGATRGTPRPESLAVRAHVPEILRTFCETWGTQRSPQTRNLGERDYDELLDFRNSARYDDRQKAALAWTDVILWDPNSADDALWQQLHAHFTEPELVELGYFIALTLGQQRWLATLDLAHGEVHVDLPATTA
jgi:hypothetical protein